MKIRTLCVAALAVVALMAGQASADVVVYQDNFDNDGNATNVGIGGGIVSGSSGTTSYNDDGSLTIGDSTSGGHNTNASSINSFSLVDGFTLEVTYVRPNANDGEGADYPSNHLSIGLSSVSATSGDFFSTTSLDGFDGIGFSLGDRAGNIAQGLLDADGVGSYVTLSTITEANIEGTQTFSLTVDATGAYTYSIGGATGTGTTTLDLTQDYFFRSRAQGLAGNSIESVTLTALEVAAVPEPSSLALLGLGAFGFMTRRRR